MEERKIGLLYLSLHNQLKKNVGFNHAIDRKKVFTILGKHYLIPKSLRCVVIKEMEKRQLIKCETKDNIVVLNCEYELSENVNEHYKEAGLIV